jgi:hypothetical protein
MNDLNALRFPIGRFVPPPATTDELRRRFIGQIAALPTELRVVVAHLAPHQLATPYRDGGWTVAQVVHHLADSHMNAYMRTRLALTEENPTIKPYDEKRWAELADAASVAIEVSLALLDALHLRWTTLLGSIASWDFDRTFQHPERGPMTIDRLVALYAWHGRHHVAHIAGLRHRHGW